MADVRDADGPLALLIDAALAEDVGDGDRTTHWTVEEGARARARPTSVPAFS
jgi:nicotinate-nucleotide pyrophosphorylase